MSREGSKKITKKYNIENDIDESSINWSKNSSQNESQEIENLKVSNKKAQIYIWR